MCSIPKKRIQSNFCITLVICNFSLLYHSSVLFYFVKIYPLVTSSENVKNIERRLEIHLERNGGHAEHIMH